MRRKIRTYSAHLTLLVIVAVLGILFILSCEQTTGPDGDVTVVTNKLILYTSRSSMTANKGSAQIFAKVYSDDDTTMGVQGVKVQFSADNAATLSAVTSVTDSSGVADAMVYAGANTGTVKITAAIQNFSNAAFLTVTSDTLKVDTSLDMKVNSNPSVLSANGTDLSKIEAQLFDTENNPIEGETITFTTTLGIIKESAVTDEWGVASVNLKSAISNGIAIVTARYGDVIKSTTVEFTGAEIKSQVVPTILVADNETRAVLTINLNDASGSPVPNGIVAVSTSLGTLYSNDGATSGVAVTDSTSAQGKVTFSISSDTEGEASVLITALGSTDSLSVFFTNYTFSLTASTTDIYAGGSTSTITAALKDKNGLNATIDDIEFSSNLGTVVLSEKKSNGTVEAILTSGSSVGTATVTATIKDPPVAASTEVKFIAAAVDSVSINSSYPSVRLGGDELEIRATVYDITGNPKSGETVSFSIIKGPGGNEAINPVTAETNAQGVATTAFVSGN
ncbi:Ig-like domain-containing protein, partial [Candidatus Latescibacterota bacterium]